MTRNSKSPSSKKSPSSASPLKTMALPALLLALAGCSSSIEGVVQGGRETFTGTSFREIGGVGSLSVASSTGAACAGDFTYTAPNQGEGTFRCNDGRVGPFTFVTSAFRRTGTGSGNFAGHQFVFTFHRN